MHITHTCTSARFHKKLSYMQICTGIPFQTLDKFYFTHKHILLNTRTSIYTQLLIRLHSHTHTLTNKHTNTCEHTQTNACIRTRTHTNTSTHTPTYTCTHTYTYTHTDRLALICMNTVCAIQLYSLSLTGVFSSATYRNLRLRCAL